MAAVGRRLDLDQARAAVTSAERSRLGVVAAFARLQVARAALERGQPGEALAAALDAVPGVAVAAELGDAGQVLRWQGEPARAWGGVSAGAREGADARVWREVGQAAVIHVLRGDPGREQLLAPSGWVEGRPWLPGCPRIGALAVQLPALAAALLGLAWPALERGEPEAPAEVQVLSALVGAFDLRAPQHRRYADGLGALISLTTGGGEWRPLREAMGAALLGSWRAQLDSTPFAFRQPALYRGLIDQQGPAVREGDLAATAAVMRHLSQAVGVVLPWELQAWLEQPFEGEG